MKFNGEGKMKRLVLLVDDSKVILKLSKKLVSEIDDSCEIVTFQSPMEALNHFVNNPRQIDFALLDYNMDELTGIELADSLSEIKPEILSLSNICIVSANIQSAVQEKATCRGINFIPKPLDKEKLEVHFKPLSQSSEA